MKKGILNILLGLALIAAGSAGIVLYEREHERQQEEAASKLTEEQRKRSEERDRAEEYRAQMEVERQRAQEAQRKLLAEDALRKEGEKNRQKQEEERLAKIRKVEEEVRQKQQRMAEEEARKQQEATAQRQAAAEQDRRQKSPASRESSRDPEQRRPKEQDSPAPSVSPNKKGQQRPSPPELEPQNRAKATVLQFDYHPGKTPELQIAHVHAGDQVVVKVRRMGGADKKLYVGLAAVAFQAHPAVPNPDRRSKRVSPPTLLATPLRDNDRFTIISEPSLGQAMAKALDAREGVILKVSTDKTPARRSPPQPGKNGFYRVEMTIYGDNKWSIKPRSLL